MMIKPTKSRNVTRDNCLNLIRIIAAMQVLFGHLVEHLELPINNTLFHATYFFRGVPVFFVMSGFLIWNSIGRSRTYGLYLRKRFWRIYPELWTAVFIELIIMVVVFHGWQMKELIMFAFGQGTIFQFWTPDSLRGYGVGTPNGALWTIGVMIQFYLIAWLFRKLMINKGIIWWVTCFIISFAISMVLDSYLHKIIEIEIVGKIYDQSIIRYFWLFCFGMLISRFRGKILPVLRKWWYVFLCLAMLFFWSNADLFSGYYLFWSTFLTVGLIGFAYRFPCFNLPIDISYGIFLYHMTVINVFVQLRLLKNWIYAIPVVCISVFLAYISTISVGALSSKKKIELMQKHRNGR